MLAWTCALHPPPVCPASTCAAEPPLLLQLIVVDPAAASPGDYTTRTEVATDEYEQAILWDHVIGRRT